MAWIGEIGEPDTRLKGDVKMILVALQYLQFLTARAFFSIK